jgi:hypothetical protein
MAKYRVALIETPGDWKPDRPDAMPAELTRPVGALDDHDDLFAAACQAIQFNGSPERQSDARWAVVVDPSGPSRQWGAGRLCTPIAYKVSVIWRPEGWEPESPLDVPNCVWKAQSQLEAAAMTYQRALETIRGLNQQCMDLTSSMWYVLVGVENEPISQVLAFDPEGTETTTQVRKLHVIRPEGGRRGSCAYCPAHDFPCARANWTSLAQTESDTQARPMEPVHRAE